MTENERETEKDTQRGRERGRGREREREFRQSSASLINDCSQRQLDSNMSIRRTSGSHCFLSPRAGKNIDRMKIRRRPWISVRALFLLSVF